MGNEINNHLNSVGPLLPPEPGAVENQNPHRPVPEALQGAAPSTSSLATFGRKIYNILSSIGSFFEASAVRIKYLVVRPSNEHRPPMVNNLTNFLPKTSPDTDSKNYVLSQSINDARKNINALDPQTKQVLEDVLADLRRSYGNGLVPKSIADLNDLVSRDIYNLYDEIASKVANSDQLVGSGRLYHLAKEIIEKPLQQRTMFAQLKDYAQKHDLSFPANITYDNDMGFYLCKKLTQALEAKGKTLEGMHDAASIQALLNSETDLVEKFITNHSLSYYVKNNQLPSSYERAISEMMADIRWNFPHNPLPLKSDELLKYEHEELDVYKAIQDLVEQSKLTLTEANFKQEARKVIVAGIQKIMVENNLAKLCQKNSIMLNVTPKLAAQIFEDLCDSIEGFEKAVADTINEDALNKLVQSKQTDILKYFAQQNDSVKEMEDKYLPQVPATNKPLMQKFIRSLLFTSDYKEQAQKSCEIFAEELKHWKDLDFKQSDQAAGKFFDIIKADMNDDLHHLEGNTASDENMNSYEDNIYTTFLADIPRCLYSVNDTQHNPKNSQALIDDLKSRLKNPTDLQFITKLCNQRGAGNFSVPLNFGQFFSNGSIQVTDEFRKSGLVIHKYDGNENVCRELVSDYQGLTYEKGIKYRIEIAADQKTCKVTFDMPVRIVTPTSFSTHVGEVRRLAVITCNLSAGSKDGQPSVEKIEYGQTISVLE
ncbi:MAG: hypothetical protein K6F05_00125 [Succinivibrio sp.]|nr:hypothetical protein [Succinivibrio sp.]